MIYITILNVPRQILKKEECWKTGSSFAYTFGASGELQHILICCWEVGEADIHIWVQRKCCQYFEICYLCLSPWWVFCCNKVMLYTDPQLLCHFNEQYTVSIKVKKMERINIARIYFSDFNKKDFISL